MREEQCEEALAPAHHARAARRGGEGEGGEKEGGDAQDAKRGGGSANASEMRGVTAGPKATGRRRGRPRKQKVHT